MYGFYDWTIIILIPAIAFTIIADAKVKRNFRRYSMVPNKKGITGSQAANIILKENGLAIPIETTRGNLTDHFDPRKNVLRLSDGVYDEPSIASVAIAAHEVGHALQHAKGYIPIKIRNFIVPVVNICSKAAWPLLIIGLIAANVGYAQEGYFLFDLGIMFFGGVVVFHAITLPVELNASSRALHQLVNLGIIYPEEKRPAKRVLNAAAMTYLAALAVAVANLIRLLILRGND